MIGGHVIWGNMVAESLKSFPDHASCLCEAKRPSPTSRMPKRALNVVPNNQGSTLGLHFPGRVLAITLPPSSSSGVLVAKCGITYLCTRYSPTWLRNLQFVLCLSLVVTFLPCPFAPKTASPCQWEHDDPPRRYVQKQDLQQVA